VRGYVHGWGLTARRRGIVSLLAACALALGAAAHSEPAAASALRASELLGPGELFSNVVSVPSAKPGPAAGGGSAGYLASERQTAKAPYRACPDGPCLMLIDPHPVRGGGSRRLALPDGGPALEGGGELGGLDPQDLQSAYATSPAGASSVTVAIVDMYGFPEAEKDLNVYRERYGLSPCTKENGCFRKVNQQGGEGHFPPPNAGWEGETALDIEMVSAACPECHILLVEGDPTALGLPEAQNTAVALGASEISNSWGRPEQTCRLARCEEEESKYFTHSGVMTFFAGGDAAYDDHFDGAVSPDYPASLPSVVAVGGTALRHAANERGWEEEPWYQPSRKDGGGSGCSRFAKPSWQFDPGCAGRMTVDVAAVGACNTPVSTYDGRWEDVCGTSASAPLVAGIEAHAEPDIRSLPGAEAFYQAGSGLNDVVKGSNGECSDAPEVAYFCRAGLGYDGPTGMGTPDGPLDLTAAAPTAETRAVTEDAGGQATLHGYVSPRGLATSYRFEYGPTTEYGSSAPEPEGSAPEHGGLVTQTITGLAVGSVYHARLVAHNADGTRYGKDIEFSTSAPAVGAVTPGTGPAGGGRSVTITGSNLAGATAVDFGPAAATGYEVESDGTITATAPPGAKAVDVTVRTPAGVTPEGPQDRFVYDPPGPALAWGANGGLLGDGEQADSDVPAEIRELGEAQELSNGWQVGIALVHGSVLGWGDNIFGQLGDGQEEEDQLIPRHACAEEVAECSSGPYLEGVTQISASRLQVLAVLGGGAVVGWGGNIYGDISTAIERSPYPVPVCTAIERPCKPEHQLRGVVEVAAGATFSLARLSDGTVLAWGSNGAGQLGTGSLGGPESCGEAGPCSRIPVAVSGLKEVTGLAAAAQTAYALLKDGTVVAWGADEAGQLGDGKTKASAAPARVCAIGTVKACPEHLGGVTRIAAGRAHGYALLANGSVASWGSNVDGELGAGLPESPQSCEVEKGRAIGCSRYPVLVKGLSGVRAIAQSASFGALVELQDGRLETWGSDESGVLGDGGTGSTETPTPVCFPYLGSTCPNGPVLRGTVTALAAGTFDMVSQAAQAGPRVTEVLPPAGPAGGGAHVTLIGGGFEGATAVNFGGTPASEFEVRSADELVAVAPPGSGLVDVTVSTPQGTSAANTEDGFTYEGAPTVAGGAATEVRDLETTLSSTVDPNGPAVDECRFEYGTSPGFGSSAQCASTPAAGASPEGVSAAVTGLQAHTTYYFRAVAHNSYGTGYGATQSFSTATTPEVGRCVKQAGGAFKKGTCATTGTSGAFEWDPWPFARDRFTVAAGAFAIVSSDVVSLSCTALSGEGEYATPQSATLALTLTGCSLDLAGQGGPCQSAGARSGEIRASAIGAQLGQVSAGSKPVDGWALGSGSGAALLTLECNGTPVVYRGSVIGALSRAGKMSASQTIAFKARKGQQAVTHFAGSGADPLTIELGSGQNERSFPAAVEAGLTFTSEEALEVKSAP
jgi:alpha-tubulin suppressor-like RCC1 family protein